MNTPFKIATVSKVYCENSKFHYPILFFLLIAMLINSSSNAQQKKNDYDLYTINDGLSQNLIYCIHQDRQGFIWLGTKDGLNKFDGYKFKIYRHDPDNKQSLSNNEIRAITEDDSGNIWIGTYGGGINKFNPSTENFTVFRNQLKDTNTISNNFITGLVFDKDNDTTLWAATIDGLNKFQITTGNCKRYYPKNKSNPKVKSNFIRCITNNNQQKIWISIMNGGLYFFDQETNSFLKPEYNDPSYDQIITCLTKDEKGNLFAGGDYNILSCNCNSQKIFRVEGGKKIYQVIKSIYVADEKIYYANFLTPQFLYQYDLNNGSHSVICDLTELFSGTNSGRIISILKDNNGNIWIGTNGNGLVKKNIAQKKFKTFQFDTRSKNKLSFASVSSIYEDNLNNIWFDGYGGLNKLDVKTGKIIPALFLKSNNKLTTEPPFLGLFSIIQSPINKDVLWISNVSDGIFEYNTKTFTYRTILGSTEPRNDTFYGKEIYDMEYDKNGNLWYASEKGLGEYVLNTGKFKSYKLYKTIQRKFPNVKIEDILIDFPRGIWVGTDGAGFALINPKENKITHYVNNPNDTNSVSGNKILSIQKSKNGTLWIGTNGSGLNKFNSEENKFTRYTTKSGLPNNVIYGILEDGNGCLWLSTNRGLSKFDTLKKIFRNFVYKDGLQSNEFNRGAYLKARDGKLYFGGIKGVTSFYPDQIVESKFNPPVVITNFLLNNKPVLIHKYLTKENKLVLSYSNNLFAFEFASLDYSNPMKNKYAYRLKGFNNNWIYTNAAQRTAAFTNIDPGSYTLQIRGTNSDGIWSKKVLSLNITIVPPFWGTLWFKILVVLLLSFLIYALYRRQISYLKAQKIQKEKFTQQLMESMENERTRIAKELHDAVGQDLLIIKNLSSLAIQNKNEKARDNYLDYISGKSQNTIDEIRQISRNLRPYLIDRLGLTKAIEAMIEDLDKVSDITFLFHSNNIDRYFTKQDAIQIYRVIQESVNNIIKHSGASEAVITIVLNKDSILITIKDDGIGIEGYEKTSTSQFGFGLSGIMERVRILKGKIDIKSTPNNGTNIFITIPIANEKSN